MQRYFLTKHYEKQHLIVLDSDIYHHMIRVMRMQKGAQVTLVLPNHEVFIAELVDFTSDEVSLKWVADEQKNTELPIHVTIACGLPKADKLEWIVQKATELGASAFQPFETSYSMVKWEAKKQTKKIERLQKIAQQAAEQSQRQVMPEVYNLLSFQNFLTTLSNYTHVIVAYEEAAKQFETTQFVQLMSDLKPDDKVLAIFGSEGGLSQDEVTSLQLNGAKTCGLGPRIMRAETAPLYVLSVLSYLFELGGKNNGN